MQPVPVQLPASSAWTRVNVSHGVACDVFIELKLPLRSSDTTSTVAVSPDAHVVAGQPKALPASGLPAVTPQQPFAVTSSKRQSWWGPFTTLREAAAVIRSLPEVLDASIFEDAPADIRVPHVSASTPHA